MSRMNLKKRGTIEDMGEVQVSCRKKFIRCPAEKQKIAGGLVNAVDPETNGKLMNFNGRICIR